MSAHGSAIDRIETFPLEHVLPGGPYGASKVRLHTRTATLVKVTTVDGAIGWGECSGDPRLLRPHLQAIAADVIGTDVSLRENAWLRRLSLGYHMTAGGPHVAAMSGLDIAMWDAAARTYGVPISALLGGRVRSSVPAYASTGYYTDEPGLGALREYIESAVAEGFTAAKIKIGSGIRDDRARTALTRELLGPNGLVIIDYNANATVDTVISSIEALRDLDLYWVEEPLPPDEVLGWAMVRRTGVAMAAGEALYTRYGFRDLIAEKRVDIVQPNLSVCGGFTEAKLISQLAAAWNLRVAPHVWGTGVLKAATLQLLAVLPETPFGQKNAYPAILEFDRGENPFREGVLQEPIRAAAGVVAIGDGPGIGVEVDEEFVRAHALDGEGVNVRRTE